MTTRISIEMLDGSLQKFSLGNGESTIYKNYKYTNTWQEIVNVFDRAGTVAININPNYSNCFTLSAREIQIGNSFITLPKSRQLSLNIIPDIVNPTNISKITIKNTYRYEH